MDLLHAEAVRSRSKIILTTEPNRGVLKNPAWKIDLREDAAILVLPTGPPVRKYGAGHGFVWVEVSDFVIFSCYISPNVDMTTFEEFLRSLQNAVRSQQKDVIITGDFNSKSVIWGSRETDRRGESIMDWLAADSLVMHNDGVDPTFIRGESESYLDLTLSTERISKYIQNWRVLKDQETLSDHEWIQFDLSLLIGRDPEEPRNATKGWKLTPQGMSQFPDKIRLRLGQTEESLTAESCEEMITDVCNECFTVKKRGNGRKSVYWWTAQIAELRRECIKARRRVVRGNTRRNVTEQDRTLWRSTYNLKKKELNMAVKKSKEHAWKQILKDLEEDIWGLGYKIVMQKLKANNSRNLTTKEQVHIARGLFPTTPIVHWPIEAPSEIPEPFTEEETRNAAKRLNPGKSPGPDGIPAELVKILISNNAKKVTDMMNTYLRAGVFPNKWKEARLVLIEKPPKPGQETSYRPICLLNVLGKLMERMLLARLEKEARPPSDRQYGFRKGRSTIDAILRVLDIGKRASLGAHHQKKICVLVALDIRNAFNSAPWPQVLEALGRKGTPKYLMQMIKSYLSDRWININELQHQMTCGVPQGSVLGPYLWNALYDAVLEARVGEGAELVAFADDLALIVTAGTKEDVISRTNLVLEQVRRQIQRIGLQIAPEKTEAVLLHTRRNTPMIRLQIAGTVLETSDSLKYLGVWLQTNMKGATHIKKTVEKAEKAALKLSRLMPNLGGPPASKRKALAGVVASNLLYAAPAWGETLQHKKYKQIMERCMRRATLRVCSAYRTASNAAVQAISGIPPAHLQVSERTRAYSTRDRNEARIWMEDKWQEEWMSNDVETAAWTRRLIPDVRLWRNRQHGDTNFHLTQFFTGHGVFGNYLLRFRLKDTDACWFCGEPDTPEHSVFECQRWEQERAETNLLLGERLSVTNLCPTMLASKEKWTVVADFITGIIKSKERYQKENER